MPLDEGVMVCLPLGVVGLHLGSLLWVLQNSWDCPSLSGRPPGWAPCCPSLSPSIQAWMSSVSLGSKRGFPAGSIVAGPARLHWGQLRIRGDRRPCSSGLLLPARRALLRQLQRRLLLQCLSPQGIYYCNYSNISAEICRCWGGTIFIVAEILRIVVVPPDTSNAGSASTAPSAPC